MKVLVTGSAGQLGRELCRAKWPSGVELDARDRSRLDIADPAAVADALESVQPSWVINAAAYTAVDKAETEAEQAFRINADGPRHLAEACARHRARLIHVSTDYVFDGSKSEPYTEDDLTSPLGVYGRSKLAGESAIRAALAQHLIVRTSWVFGAFGHNFVKTIVRLAGKQERLRVVADQLGRPTPAADLAAALAALATAGEPAWGTYHFAGAGRTSWHGFASAVVELQAAYTGLRPALDGITTAEYPTPARRPMNSELDTSKLERAFGLQPRPWRDGLSAVIDELFSGAVA